MASHPDSSASPAEFVRVQQQFARHMRDPQVHPAPQDIEDRRLQIYRDLIFNNIESFLRGGFPILRSLYQDGDWYELIRRFVRDHQSQSPYFVEISQEFLTFLQEEHQPRDCDPPFMLELAHYEWVELALDISPERLPVTGDERLTEDLLSACPVVSPLLWTLSYQYPVHLIGPEFQPLQPPEQPTFLLVYRNRKDEVQFMAVNPMTVRVLELLQDETVQSGEVALGQVAQEIGHPNPQKFTQMGMDLLQKLQKCDIIF